MEEKNKSNFTEESLERELEKLVEDMPEQNEDFEKKIDRYINKKIRKITVKTVLVIFGIIFVLFLIISPGMDAVYLNPEKLQKNQTFLSVMRDYYDVTRPYIEINDIQVEKKGFGRYTLGISATNNIKSRNIGVENVWVDLEQGKYKLEIDIDKNNGQELSAPSKGEMTRTIIETAACAGEFRFYKNDDMLFSLKSNNVSFEYEA